MPFPKLVFSALLFAALASCGYRLAARKGDAGAGQTIAVQTFTNLTNRYRIEQGVSDAIRKELARTTRYKVSSGDSGDIVVSGEVLGYGVSATVVDERGRASQYTISVLLKVLVTETASGKALYRNDAMTFRETFQLSQSSTDFVPEDPAAVSRLATRFASEIVAAIVHRQS